MKTYRNLFLSTLAILIVAVAALTTLWLKEAPPSEKVDLNASPSQDSSPVSQQLGFDDQQKQKFDLMVEEFREDVTPQYLILSNLQHSVADELIKQNPDTVLISRLNDSMASVYLQIRKLTGQHILRVKTICTPQQTAVLGNLYKNMIDENNRARGYGNGVRGGEGKGQRRHRHRNGQPWR